MSETPKNRPDSATSFTDKYLRPTSAGPSTVDFTAARSGYSQYQEPLNKYDYGLSPSLYESGYEKNPALAQQYNRSSNQSAARHLWNGFWSRGLSIGTKLGQGIGHVGGAAVDLWNFDGLSATYDNAMVKAFSEMDENLKKEIPVYQSKAYQEGNWIQKAGTTSFWALDGFDGVAFLASAYIPGGVAAKIPGSIRASLLASNRAKAASFGKKLSSFTDATGLSSRAGLVTMYNTVSEAGFEAHEVNKKIRDELARARGYNDYASITEQSDKDFIADRAGESAARVFWWNQAALLAPNFLQNKWFHGSAAKQLDNRIAELRRNPGLAAKADMSVKQYISNFGKGVLSEGLWEENIQEGVQQYEERLIKGQATGTSITEPLSNVLYNGWSFIKSVGTFGLGAPEAGTDEDQASSAILLGSLLGGGMSAYGSYRNQKAQSEQDQKILADWDNFKKIHSIAKNILADDFKIPFKSQGVDAEGNPIYTKDQNTELSFQAAHNMLVNLQANQAFSAEDLLALKTGSATHMDYNKKMSLASYAWNLASSIPNVQDIKDLLELDPNFDTETQGELADQDSLQEHKEFVLSLIEAHREVFGKVGGADVTSESLVDRRFAEAMLRNEFVMLAKEQIFAPRLAIEQEQALEREKNQENYSAQAYLDKFKLGLGLTKRPSQMSTKERADMKKLFMAEVGPILEMHQRVEELKNQLKATQEGTVDNTETANTQVDSQVTRAKEVEIERINKERQDALKSVRKPIEKGFERLNTLLNEKGVPNNEKDAIQSLNEIQKLRKNLEKGLTKEEENKINELESYIKEKFKLEIVSQLGKKFDTRDTTEVVNFTSGENNGDNAIYSTEIRPQVNKNGVLAQAGQYDVLQEATQEEIDNALNNKSGKTVKKINAKYKAQIAALEQSATSSDPKNKGITQQEYNEEVAKLAYLAAEAQEIYGLDLSPNPMNGKITDIASQSFPSMSVNTLSSSPKSYWGKSAKAAGRAVLSLEALRTAQNTVSQVESMLNAREIEDNTLLSDVKTHLDNAKKALSDVLQVTDYVTEDLNILLETIDTSIDYIRNSELKSAIQSTLEDLPVLQSYVTEGEHSQENQDVLDYLGVDGATMTLKEDGTSVPLEYLSDRMKELLTNIQELENELSQAKSDFMQILSEVPTLKEGIELGVQKSAEASMRGNLKEQHKALVDTHFREKVEFANKLVKEFDENPKQFMREKEVQHNLKELMKMKLAYTDRQDIGNTTSQLKTIESLINKYQEMFGQVVLNKLDRIARQANVRMVSSDVLTNALGIQDGTVSGPYKAILIEAFGSEQRLMDILAEAKIGENEYSTKALIAMLQTAGTKVLDIAKVKDVHKAALKIFEGQYKAIENMAMFIDVNGYLSNVNKFGPTLVAYISGTLDQMKNPESPMYAYSKHNNIFTFIYDLQTNRDSSGNIKGMTKEQTQKVEKAVDIVVLAHAHNLIYSSLISNLNTVTAFNNEIDIYDSLSKLDNPIAPSAEQVLAIQELLNFVSQDKKGGQNNEAGAFSNFAVLQGVLGSGKSLVGLKFVVNILKNSYGYTDENIAAFGHNKNSSKIIGSSVYEGDKVMSAEEFLDMDMSSINLVIIDEAMALDNSFLEQVNNKILEENESRSTPVKVIALGDPSQITVEQPEFTALGSAFNPQTMNTTGFSVVYRTNISSIIDLVLKFKDNPSVLSSYQSTTSHSLQEINEMKTVDDVYGIQGGSLSEMLSILSKPSTKSRVVIVNNATAAELMRRKVDPSVEVLTYFEAQSITRDQVYLFMDSNAPNWQNQAFSSPLEFNTAMYTMVGRAKEFAFIANPDFTIDSPIVSKEIAVSSEDLSVDLESNQIAYEQDLAATRSVLEKINPASPLKKLDQQPSSPQTKGQSPITKQAPVNVIESSPEQLLDNDIDKTFEDISEEPDQTEDGYELEVEHEINTPLSNLEKGEFRHSFAFPTNLIPLGKTGGISIDADKTADIVYTDTGRVVLIQQSSFDPNRYLVVAVLGNEDLQGDMSALIQRMGSSPIADSEISSSTSGLEWDPSYEGAKLATVQFDKLHGPKYLYKPGDQYSDFAGSIMDKLLSTFYQGFYTDSKGGRGSEPTFEFWKNGQLNWTELSKHVKVRVFSDREVNRLPQDETFRPMPGVPYMVLKNMGVKEGKSSTKSQYIRMEPRRMNAEDEQIKTLSSYNEIASLLEKYNIRIGTKVFNKLLNTYRQRLTVNVENVNGYDNGKVAINTSVDMRAEILAAINEMTKINKQVVELDPSGKEIDRIQELMDEVSKLLFGSKYTAARFTKQEAQNLVKSDPQTYHHIEASKKLATQEKTDTAKVWIVYDEENIPHKRWEVSTLNSPAQKALNSLARANKKAGDLQIRFKTTDARTGKGRKWRVAKSLATGDTASNAYYAWKQAELLKMIDELGTIPVTSHIPREIFMQPNEQGQISTSKMEEGLESFFTTIEKEDPSIHSQVGHVWGNYVKAKVIARTELESKPITRDLLTQIIEAAPEMRLPLDKSSFNKRGENLDKPENRDYVNQVLGSNLSKILPSTVSGKVQLNPLAKRSPEQKLKKAPEPQNVPSVFDEVTGQPSITAKFAELKAKSGISSRLIDLIEDKFNKSGTRVYILQQGQFPEGLHKATAITYIDSWRPDYPSSVGPIIIYKSQEAYDKVSPAVFGHEVIHALTLEAIENGKADTGTKADRELFRKLTELKTIFDIEAPKNTGKPLKQLYQSSPSDPDLHEFIASFTKKEFRQAASNIFIDAVSVLNQFFRDVAKWFGWSVNSKTKDFSTLQMSVEEQKQYRDNMISKGSVEKEVTQHNPETVQITYTSPSENEQDFTVLLTATKESVEQAIEKTFTEFLEAKESSPEQVLQEQTKDASIEALKAEREQFITESFYTTKTGKEIKVTKNEDGQWERDNGSVVKSKSQLKEIQENAPVEEQPIEQQVDNAALLQSLYEEARNLASKSSEDVAEELFEVINEAYDAQDIEELQDIVDTLRADDEGVVRAAIDTQILSKDLTKDTQEKWLNFFGITTSQKGNWLPILVKTAKSSLFIDPSAMKRLISLANNYSTSAGLGLQLRTTDVLYESLVKHIWNTGLEKKGSSPLHSSIGAIRTELARKDVYYINAPVSDIVKKIIEYKGDDKAPASVKRFFRDINALLEIIQQNTQTLSEVSKELTSTSSQYNARLFTNTSSSNFIFSNFSSPLVYMVARDIVLDKMNAEMGRNRNDNSREVLSKQELLLKLIQSIRTGAAIKLREYNKSDSPSMELSASLAAYNDLLKSYKGKPLLFYVLSEVYPNWSIQSALEVQDFVDVSDEYANRKEKLVGISKETQDNDNIDVETTMSDSLKEFLAFMKNPMYAKTSNFSKKFMSSKHTFVTAMTLSFEFLNLSDLSTWDEQMKFMSKVPLSEFQREVLDELDRVIRTSTREIKTISDKTKNLALFILEDSLDNTSIGFAYDPKIELAGKTFNEVKAINPQVLKIKNITPAALRAEINSVLDSPLSVQEFNFLYRKIKAQDVKRELSNVFGSLTEKSYKIGITDYGKNGKTTKYINAAGFGFDKTIYSAIRIRLETLFDKDSSIKSISSQLEAIRKKATKGDIEAIKDFLNFFGMSEAVDVLDLKVAKNSDVLTKIKSFVESLSQVAPGTEVEDFLSDERSIFRSLARVLQFSEDQLRKKSVIDGNNNKVYTSVPGSFFYDVLDSYLKSKDESIPSLKGFNPSQVLPNYLRETELFRSNPFLNGLNTIYSIGEHDASKNEFTQVAVPFNRESPKAFYNRVFQHGFFDTLANTNGQRYNQYLYQVADRPKMPTVEVDFKSEVELEKIVEGLIEFVAKRPDAFISSKQKKHDGKRILNFSALEDVLNEMYPDTPLDQMDKATIKKLAKEVLYRIKTYAREFTPTLAANGIQFSSTTKQAISAIKSSEAFARSRDIQDVSVEFLSFSKKNIEEDIKSIAPIIELMYMNNYINSYALTSMLIGPFEFFKGSEDIVKRLSGLLAPGIKPMVSEVDGVSRFSNILVLQDRAEEATTLENLFETLGEELNETERAQLREFAQAFDSTDAQGFMSEKRWNNLSRGFSQSYKLGNIMKPVYFGHTVEDNIIKSFDNKEAAVRFAAQYGGRVEGTAVYGPVSKPTYLKYSSVKMSQELTTRYPVLGKIAEYMDRNGIDEIIFKSGVKVGADIELTTLEDVYEGAPHKRLLKIDNNHYRMQYNPKAKIDSHTAIFTQLMYFLNIMGDNTAEAQTAYSAVSYLMENSMSELKSELSSSIRGKVKSLMTSPGTERLQDMINNGISLSNPAIAEKVFNVMASYVESKVQRIKFPGAKLILQSDEGITKPSITYTESKSAEENFQEGRLKYIKLDGNRLAAEVIVPRRLLTEDMLAALEAGESLFLQSDFLSYRIPSTELHSALPLKVVGVYDTENTNVIIAPADLVYLHGSDFDVDSLFVIKRSYLEPSEANFLGLDKNVPIGYIKGKSGKYEWQGEPFIQDIFSRLQNRRTALLSTIEKGAVEKEELDILKREGKYIDSVEASVKRKYALNVIFQTMLSAVEAPKNRARMLTPIVMSLFNGDNNSLKTQLEAEGLWEDNELADMSRIENSQKALQNMKDGALLTGVFANNIKVLAYLYRAGKNGSIANLKDKHHMKLYIDGTEYTFDGISDYDKVNGYLTWQYQDGTVNLAIDNLTELTLPKLGVNIFTGNAYSVLLGTGIPLLDATLIVKNPLVQEIATGARSLLGVQKEIVGLFEEIKTGVRPESIVIKDFEKQLDQMVAYSSTIQAPSREDLLEVAKGGGSKYAKMGALIMFYKAYKVGESVKELANILDVLRRNPGTTENLMDFISTFNGMLKENFKTFSSKVEGDIDLSLSPQEYQDSYSQPYGLEFKDTFAFEAPEFFDNNPHVVSALKAVSTTKGILASHMPRYTDEILDVAQSVLSQIKFERIGQNEIKMSDILNDIEHILISSIIFDRVVDTPSVKVGKAGREVSGYVAFVNRLKRKINAAKIADDAAYLANKDGYVKNRFLSSLMVESKGIDKVMIRLANNISPDRGDIALLRQGFDELSKFEFEENSGQYTAKIGRSSELKEDLLHYAIIDQGFKTSATSVTGSINELLYKDIDAEFERLYKSIASSKTKIDELVAPLMYTLVFKYATELPNLPDKELRRQVSLEGSKFQGYDESLGLHFDTSYKTEGKEPADFPRFAKLVSREENYTNYIVYERLTSNEEIVAGRPALYSKIGVGNKRYNFVDYRKFRVQRFRPTYKNINVTNIKSDILISPFYKFEVGERIRLLTKSDYMRMESRVVEVVEATPVVKGEELRATKYTFKQLYEGDVNTTPTSFLQEIEGTQVRRSPSNEIEQVFSPIGQVSKLYQRINEVVPDKEAALQFYAVFSTGDLRSRDELGDVVVTDAEIEGLRGSGPRAAADTVLEAAASNLPPLLNQIKRQGSSWKVGTDPNYYTNGTLSVSRVTGDEGPINMMRATPFSLDIEGRAKVKAESKFNNVTESTILSTEYGELSKSEYIKKLTSEMSKWADMGTITHKILQTHLMTDQASIEESKKEILQLIAQNEFSENQFNWLSNEGNYKRIFEKAGLNVYSEQDPNLLDKVASEVTVVDNEFFGWGGTIDLLIQHSDGTLGLRDFKSGLGFNKEISSALFKYGVQNNISILQNPRNTAKLQLMLYAMIIKMQNPDVKFNALEITWIPSRKEINRIDPKKRVEVEDFLGMIYQYLKNEKPAEFAKLRQKLGPQNFSKLFNPSEYEHSYESNTKKILKESNINAKIAEKLDILKALTFYDLAASDTNAQKIATRQVYDSRARKLFLEVNALVNDIGFKPEEFVQDISWMSMWIASNAHQNSPYVQLYDKILKARKLKATQRMQKLTERNISHMKKIREIYWRVHGKPLTENVPLLKGFLSMTNTRKMFEWMYTDRVDANNNVIGKKMRTTPAEWTAAKEKFSSYTEADWKTFQSYTTFLNDYYKSIFIGEAALANKLSTYRTVYLDGEAQDTRISNLALHNEYRAKQNSSPFEYYDGWFPKVNRQLDEFGHIWDKPYREELYKRHFTIHHEDVFEQELNQTEVIPMKYLGSVYMDTSENYSLNAEVAFDKFMRNSVLKEEMEDVYAYGQALISYLEKDKRNKDNQGNTMYGNTVQYLRTALEAQIRNRKQLSFPGGFIQRNGSVIRTGDGKNVYMLDWAKLLRTIKTAAAAPIMWLKPLQGTANGVFIYLYTLKEALKNDLLATSKLGRITGVDRDELAFGVKDLLSASSTWFGVQRDAMTGNLGNNKAFLLAKHLGYMPNDFTRSMDSTSYVSVRNKIFEQSTMYMFHTIFEDALAMITMVAQLKSMRTKDGKSMWDHYNVEKKRNEDGEVYSTIEWDGYVRANKRLADGSLAPLQDLDENEIRTVYHVYERLQGGYREDERTMMEYYIFGEIFMQFRKFLPNILKLNFGSRKRQFSYGSYKPVETYKEYKEEREAIVRAASDPEQQKLDTVQWHARVTEGRWKVLGGLMLSWLPTIVGAKGKPTTLGEKLGAFAGLHHNESYKWSNLAPFQREVVVDFSVTFFMIAMLSIGHMIMFGGADDDDSIKKYYSRIAKNFSQQWNPYEIGKDMLSTSAWPATPRQAWGLISSSTELGTSLMLYTAGLENEALNAKGDLKGWTQFQRHVRFLSSAYDVRRFIENIDDENFDIQIRR